MMVQDLINELQGYPPELEVLFLDSELDAVPGGMVKGCGSALWDDHAAAS
jgi:hypothetical protein